MITSENGLATRLKMLERFKTSFPWLGNQVKSLRVKGFKKLQTAELVDKKLADLTPDPAEKDGRVTHTLSLEKAMETYGLLTPYTVLIGICEDNIPLTIDLTNPAPGAILILGDAQCGKTRLARAMLSSSSIASSPAQVVYTILAADVHEYTDLAEFAHCHRLIAGREAEAAVVIDDLYNEIEQRRTKPGGPVKLLLIENLGTFVRFLEASRLARLLRLIKHGPRLGIWVLATLPASAIERIDPALLDAFRTHLLGRLDDPVLATYLSGDASCPAGQLEEGRQFCACVAGEWLSFWICDPAGGGE